jgi:hypothetical protein
MKPYYDRIESFIGVSARRDAARGCDDLRDRARRG